MAELILLTPDWMEALLEGRREELPFRVPADWPDAHDSRFLALRLRQSREDPRRAEWYVRAVVLDGELIGHAGFHGPPGVNARRDPEAVEIGYTTFEPFRGRGLATEAVRLLLESAQERGVRRVIASVSPDNAPSLAIVRKLGFVEVGRHWDDEDGEELEFEVELSDDAS